MNPASVLRQRLRVLVVVLLLVVAQLLLTPAQASWLSRRKPRPDISSSAACRNASSGHVPYQGDAIYPPLHAFFRVNGPAAALPKNTTDITTAATIIQLAVPGLRLVLDPLLFLRASSASAQQQAGVGAGGGGAGKGRNGQPQHGGVPPLIHMTLRNKRSLSPHHMLSMVSWGRFNPGHALLLYDDSDIAAYMARYAPGFLPTFNQLKTPVEKSDAWRYHVLCGHGGVYADTDTLCVRPFSSWANFNSTPQPGLIVGVENRFHSQAEAEEATYVHKIQMTQWVLASKKNHPVVCGMGAAIKAYVEDEAVNGNAVEEQQGHDASILLRTGPGIWSKEVHAYIQQMGSTSEEVAQGGQVSDLVVLPQQAFACNFRYWHESNSDSILVYHMFANSWKKDHFKVADAKKAARRNAARAKAMAKIRMLYPLLIVLSAAFGVLLALYGTLCWLTRGSLPDGSYSSTAPGDGSRGGGWGSGAAALLLGRARRRPHALVASSSPRGSPRSGSSSPRKGASGSSGISSTARLLLSTTRKAARLHD